MRLLQVVVAPVQVADVVTVDPVRRIAARRRIIDGLRAAAVGAGYRARVAASEAVDLRGKADKLERETDTLERETVERDDPGRSAGS